MEVLRGKEPKFFSGALVTNEMVFVREYPMECFSDVVVIFFCGIAQLLVVHGSTHNVSTC